MEFLPCSFLQSMFLGAPRIFTWSKSPILVASRTVGIPGILGRRSALSLSDSFAMSTGYHSCDGIGQHHNMCMHMYMCAGVCAHVCRCVCTCVQVCVHMCAGVCAHVCRCVCTCVQVCVHMCAGVCVYMCEGVYVCTCEQVCVYTC